MYAYFIELLTTNAQFMKITGKSSFERQSLHSFEFAERIQPSS